MGSYFIECPSCKRTLKAGTGLFAKKTIKCSCGCVITPGGKAVKFHCPGCSVELTVDNNASTYVCPMCNLTIDVQSCLLQEQNKGKTSVIKWDVGQNDIFIYHHPIRNFNIGSQLIVMEGQKAIFFRNGKALDVFGPGRHLLEAQKLPLLEEVFKFPADADLTFDSSVFFVRTNRLNIKWGIPSIQMRNPGMDFYVKYGISGSMDIQLIDSPESARRLLEAFINATSGEDGPQTKKAYESYTSEYVANRYRSDLSMRISDWMTNIVKGYQINLLDIEGSKSVIADRLRFEFNKILENDGLMIPPYKFNIERIPIHNSDDVERWMKQESERVLRVREEAEVRRAEAQARQGRVMVEEQTDAQTKVMRAHAQGEATKITGQAEADAYLAQALAEAEEMRAKGYTYSDETRRMVGTAAMQNGLPGTQGGGGAAAQASGIAGDMIGLGIGLGAMGTVAGMARDLMAPIAESSAAIGKAAADSVPLGNKTTAWNCSCGQNCITTNFCPNCGSPKPAPAARAVWNCKCGCRDITSKFCPDCGSPRPEEPSSWDCPDCGCKNITSKFCPDCGRKRD